MMNIQIKFYWLITLALDKINTIVIFDDQKLDVLFVYEEL